jgi:3-hydroxybutyryl-CoA dehydrogenase
MIDLKERTQKEREKYRRDLKRECLAVTKLFRKKTASVPLPVYHDNSKDPYDLIFEGLPENLSVKQNAFLKLGWAIRKETLICSMTSTFTVEELKKTADPSLHIMVTHFMNPPYLIPFLEVIPHPEMNSRIINRFFAFLKGIGHMPIRCRSSSGFVISRLQLCVMNEAVRIMEEGVASPEDIDKAIEYGWGYRFPVMGILRFIDAGGLEILYHASHSVSKDLNRPDLLCPKLIEERFTEGATGIKALRGIFDYESERQVKKIERERVKKQIQLKKLLDTIHRKEGAWKS